MTDAAIIHKFHCRRRSRSAAPADGAESRLAALVTSGIGSLEQVEKLAPAADMISMTE
jgi:hypothetical protein